MNPSIPVDLGTLPGIGQIGIVVHDHAEAMAAYSAYLGVPRWFRAGPSTARPFTEARDQGSSWTSWWDTRDACRSS